MNLVLAITLGAFNSANTILLEEKDEKDRLKEIRAAKEREREEYEKQLNAAHVTMDSMTSVVTDGLNDFDEERERLVQVRHCLHLVFPLPPRLRHRLRRAFPLPPWLSKTLPFLAVLQEAEELDWEAQGVPGGKCRNAAKGFVTSRLWSEVVTFIVLCYIGLLLMRRTDDTDVTDDARAFADTRAMILLVGEDVILGFFTIEIICRLLGLGIGLFFRSQENVLDLIIFLCTVIGTIAVQLTGQDETLLENSLYSFMRLLRVAQVVRMMYKVPSIYKIMQQVLKSWKALLGCVVFLLFAVIMGSIIGMHVLGGGLGHLDPEKRVGTIHEFNEFNAVNSEEYPRRNFETFDAALLATLQVMFADSWSEIMLWYMTHGQVGLWAAAFFPALYLFTYGIMFNTFVSVLLINFATEEANKMPLQRRLYWEQDADLDIDEEDEQMYLDSIIAKETSREVVDDDDVNADDALVTLLKGAPEGGGMLMRSLFILGPHNPVRIFCASIQQTGVLKLFTASAAVVACVSLVQQGASAGADEGGGGAKMDDIYYYADYYVIFALSLELFLKTIQGGFVLVSGPTDPYLIDPWNVANLIVLMLMVGSSVAGSIDPSIDPLLQLIRGMAPMVGLMQIGGIRKIVVAWLQTLPATATVFVPVFFIGVMFAIIGQDIFGGRLKRCICLADWETSVSGDERCPALAFSDSALANATAFSNATAGTNVTMTLDYDGSEAMYDPLADVLVVGKETCQSLGVEYVWGNPPAAGDFDGVTNGLVALFKMSSNGYSDTLEYTIDIPHCPVVPVEGAPECIAKRNNPEEDASRANVFFFVAFHLMFSLFLMNLFIGVMSAHFSVQNGKSILTESQKRHRQGMKDAENFEPTFSYAEKYRPHESSFLYGLRKPIFAVVTNKCFNLFCDIVIIVNVIILANYSYPMKQVSPQGKAGFLVSKTAPFFSKTEPFLGHSQHQDLPGGLSAADLLEYVNIGINVWYAFEVLLRMIAFGGPHHYLASGWNQFDFVVMLSAWLLIIGKAPSGLEVLRVLRCLKLVSANKAMRSLMELINVVMICVLDSGKVFAVAAVVFYIYTVVGMKTFGQLETFGGGNPEPDFTNPDFTTFFSSFKTLFEVMCGSG